jgi:hypothetical protein
VDLRFGFGGVGGKRLDLGPRRLVTEPPGVLGKMRLDVLKKVPLGVVLRLRRRREELNVSMKLAGRARRLALKTEANVKHQLYTASVRMN